MAEVIRMPRMSDTMTEGVIVSWLKKPGDKVKSGDILAEVETDKATMELENYTDGVLLYVGVKEGEAVPVNGILAVVGKEGEDYKSLLEKELSNQQGQQQADKGEQQQEPQIQGKPAPDAGQKESKSSQPPQQSSTPQPEPESKTEESDRIKASPLAKKLAAEKGIPLEQLKGSGDNGRIVRKDIESYKGSTGGNAKRAASGAESFEDVPVSQMRKTIARRLAESKFSAPHFYLTIDINMNRAVEARKRVNDFLGSKISYNDLVIKACAAALRRHPKVNASWLGDKIRYYGHVHIGVAIAVEEGLIVPVVRFADGKSLSEIAGEVKELADKAKSKKLQPADWEGNTFTISNLGMFGIEEFTAIINPPDACILAVGAIREVPVIENGEVVAGNMMKVTLSCDHRVVDGATGAQFLQTVKQYLEEPVTILA